MGKVISIANTKGGVGKTSLTLGIGASLNQLGQRVLLVDMDSASALTYAILGDDAGDLELSIYDVLISDTRHLEEILIEAGQGLYLLPSSLSLDNLEADARDRKQYLLRDRLKALRKEFDWILIDTPPRLGLLSINALVASDGVWTAIIADILSYRALFGLRSIIEEIAARYNKGLELEGIIINFYDRRRNLERFIREKVLKEYKDIAFKASIRRSVAVPESIMVGKTIFQHASRNPVASDLLGLAREILRREG